MWGAPVDGGMCGGACDQCDVGMPLPNVAAEARRGEPVSQSLLLLLLPMVPILSSILSLSCRTSTRWLGETDRMTLLVICNMRLEPLFGDGGGWYDCELVRRR